MEEGILSSDDWWAISYSKSIFGGLMLIDIEKKI